MTEEERGQEIQQVKERKKKNKDEIQGHIPHPYHYV